MFINATNAGDVFKKGNNLPKKPFATQKDITKGGFFFNFGLFIPNKNYGFESDVDNTTSYKNGVGPSFEIGNMFRIADLRDKAIGIRVTWLNVGYSKFKMDGELIEQDIQFSMFKLGPYFSLGLNDKMAIDFYYQIAPQYIFSYNVPLEEDDHYFGVNHSLGATYRFSILAVGFDANFGSAKYLNTDPDESVDFKPRFPYLRMYVGLKL